VSVADWKGAAEVNPEVGEEKEGEGMKVINIWLCYHGERRLPTEGKRWRTICRACEKMYVERDRRIYESMRKDAEAWKRSMKYGGGTKCI
jgi:hypothetical protein